MEANPVYCSCGAEIKTPEGGTAAKTVCAKCQDMAVAPAQPAKNPRLKLKTLVVDDSGVSRRALRCLLESMGCEVIETPDAFKAMDKALALRPDVILLDYHMPMKNGLEFLKELKSNATTRGTPVVMHTVENEKDIILECMRAGASDYVVKPAQKPALYAKLSRLAARLRSRAANH